jgi:hypothetical protein
MLAGNQTQVDVQPRLGCASLWWVMSAGQALMGMGMDSGRLTRQKCCEARAMCSEACLAFLVQPGKWSVRSNKRPIMAMGSTYFLPRLNRGMAIFCPLQLAIQIMLSGRRRR